MTPCITKGAVRSDALNQPVQLFEQIGCVLTGETRKRAVALSLGTVTRGTRRNLPGRHSFHKDLFALSDQRRIAALAFRRADCLEKYGGEPR